MKIWVAVLGFQGLVDDVKAGSHDQLMEEITKHLKNTEETPGKPYTAESWFAELGRTNEYPDQDYDPTNLYEVELPDPICRGCDHPMAFEEENPPGYLLFKCKNCLSQVKVDKSDNVYDTFSQPVRVGIQLRPKQT